MTVFTDFEKDLGPVKPESLSIAHEVFLAAKFAGHDVWHMWGYDNNAGNAEHHSGLALDFMVHNHEAGQWVRDYIWTNRARLHLQHVIWEQHITSTAVSPGVVRLMADRGSVTDNHMDHVHALFYAHDYQTPGGSSPTPGPAPSAPPLPTHDDQLAVDGVLGPKTIAKWQQVMGTPVDGVISKPSLLIKAVQRKLADTVDRTIAVDGYMGKLTIAGLQRYLKSPVDGVLSAGYSNCVAALQRRLNSGWF